MSVNIADFGMTDLKPSDNQLLSDVKSGDPQAFAECVKDTADYLSRGYLASFAIDEDAEDVLQDAFLITYQHLHKAREAAAGKLEILNQ